MGHLPVVWERPHLGVTMLFTSPKRLTQPMFYTQTPRVSPLTWIVAALFGLLGLVPPVSQAQDTPTLIVREDGFMRSEQSIAIAHSDDEATTPPNPETFDAEGPLFFRYVPVGDWTLNDRDDELESIRVEQGDATVSAESVSFIDENTAVATFPSSDLVLHKPFVFANDIESSEELHIEERYFPMYDSLRVVHETALDTAPDAPLDAVDALVPFLDAGEATASMALYDSTMQTLDSLATTLVDVRNDSLEALREEMSPPTKEALDRVAAFRARLDTTAAVLAPYLDAHEQVASDMDMLLDATTSLEEGGYSSFRRSTMELLARNNYDDYQMRRSLALLTRLLADPDAPTYDGMQPDSLHLSQVEDPAFESYRNELESYGWMGDFEDLLYVVNTNLEEHNVVFQDEVMRNLRLQRPGAPEPYYELANVFNVAGEGDLEAIDEALNNALAKMTDPAFLDNVQRWRMRIDPELTVVDERAQETIDEGLAQLEAGNLEAARATMVRASRLAGGSPLVPYYQGQIARAQGDLDSAILYFERARERTPWYVSPALESIEARMDVGEYERAVAQADSVLTDQPYWLVYYAKARALMGAEAYEDAQSVLQSRCEPLNDEDPDLYLTLGDVYMGQEQWDGARWAYEQAGSINPENPDFAARMDSLRTELNDRGIAFDEVEPETQEIDVSGPPEP